MKKIVTAIFAAMVSFGVFAANYYWNPDVSTGNWDDAENWCTDAACTTPSTKAPGNKDAVYFDGTKISSPVTVNCNNATSFTITINLTGADSGLQVTLNGAKMTPTCKLASGTTLVFDDGSQITYGGDATTATGSTLRIKGGTTFTYNATWNVYNSTLEILEGSVVTIGTHLYTKNSTILIDNATLHVRYYVYNYGPDTFVFKGENPVLKSGRDYFRGMTGSAVCNLNFEVPVGGYKEPPVQYLDGATKIFASSSSGFSYNINVLASSPAFTSTQYKTDCPLVYSFAGITRSFCKFNNALNAAGASALRYCTGDGVTEMTTDADSVAIYASLGSGDPATPPSCDYSKGVALVSIVSNTVTATSSRRTVTVTSSVTALATSNRTRARLLQGEEFNEAALSEVASADLAALGRFSLQWTAPNNQLNKTYYFQIILETLDANDEVVYSEKTPVKPCTTWDDSTYTWNGGNGDWSDPANWSASDETDRVDYPDSKYVTVIFPAGCYTVTVDRAYNVGTFTANAAGSDITFVSEENAAFENAKIAVNTTLSISASSLSKLSFKGIWLAITPTTDIGNGNRIFFDGCKVGTARVNSNGTGETYFKDSTVTVLSMFLGGGGSRDVKTLTLDNSSITASDSVYPGNTIGGRMIFKGAGAKLLLNGAGKQFQAYTKNANFTFDFEVPVGGYTEAPIQTCSAKTTTAFADTNAGVVNYFNILPESPALQVKGSYTYLLMDWKGKTPSSNYINKGKCNFDGTGSACNTFVFDDNAKPTQISIEIRNTANEDCLEVVGNPDNYGVPTPAYGVSFGHTANESVSFSLAATSVTNAGVACEYQGYVISNATDVGAYVFAGSGSESSFTYTHPANAAGQVTLLWARSYALSVDRNYPAGGTVSTAGGSYAEGSTVTITATPASADGYAFRRWDGDIGKADATSPTITMTMDQVRTITAVFGRTRYVAENGNNEYTGYTTEDPLATIQEAVSRSLDEDEVVILPGEYDLSGTILLEKAVTVRGASGRPEDVIIHGGNKNNAQVKYHMFNLNHPAAFIHSVTLQDGMISGNWTYGSAIFIATPGYDGNSKTHPAGNGGTASNCVVRSCKDTGKFGGAPVWVDSPAGLVSHLIITNNTATRQGDSTGSRLGFALNVQNGGMARDCLIARNRDTADGAGSCVCVGANSTIANLTVVNNSAVGTSTTAGIWASAATARVLNCVVAGNTCNAGTVEQCCYGGTASAFQRCVFDLYAPNDACYAGAELGLTDLAGGDYHPTAASKCVNFGIAYDGMSTKDLDGNPRVIGGTIDAGCYERDTSVFSVGFAPDVASGFAPLTVTFTPTLTGVEPGDSICLSWDFDNDGEVDLVTTDLEPVAHEFAAGHQSVALTGENLTTGKSGDSTMLDVVHVGVKMLYVKNGNDGAAVPFDCEANAAADLQSAIDEALPGATIYLYDGDYPVSSCIKFNKEVTITSLSGNRDAVILRGRAKTSGDNRVMEFDAAPAALLHSVTIADGYAANNSDAGGIYLHSKGGTVSNCVITGCSDAYKFARAGGIYANGANALVTHCIISNNYGRCGYSDGAYANGSAICLGGGARCTHTLITRNGVHPSNSYDGLQPDNSTVQVDSNSLLDFCTVVSNKACYVAGVSVASGAKVRYCVIAGNYSAHADDRIIRGANNVGKDNATAEQVNRWNVWGVIGSYSTVASGYSAGVLGRDKYVCDQELANYAAKATCFTNCITDAVQVNGSVVATVDAVYRDAANVNFKLLGTSKARNAVNDVDLAAFGISMPEIDVFGNPRLNGKRYDIGAVECQAPNGMKLLLK